MKQKNKLALLVLIGISFFYFFGVSCTNSLAEGKQLNFEKNKEYDIYYQAENHTKYIKNVEIIDTVTIGGVVFLEIKFLNIFRKKDGYISVSNIIAILPAGSPRF